MEFLEISLFNRRDTARRKRKMFIRIGKSDEIRLIRVLLHLNSEPGSPLRLSMLKTREAFVATDNLWPSVRQLNESGVFTVHLLETDSSATKPITAAAATAAASSATTSHSSYIVLRVLIKNSASLRIKEGETSE